MTDESVLLTEVAERVATVTLNRPQQRNALNSALRRSILVTLAALETDDGVDAIVLTGADPAFCAGLDLKEIGDGRDSFRGGGTSTPVRGPVGPVTKPLIGAINGVAVTGGLELALNCDFLIASERAAFADTHARVGIQPGWGLTVLLPEAIGLRRAREMSATGNFVDAGTALAWGLVNHVVAHAELLPFCVDLGRAIASNDGAAVRRVLATYQAVHDAGPAQGWALEAQVSADWLKNGAGTSEEVERRRLAIVERGRSQVTRQ